MFNATNGDAMLSDASFSSNTAGEDGGGLYNNNDTVELTNVTFSGNSATGEYARGGGLANREGNAVLVDVTFTNNLALAGGGVYIVSCGGIHSLKSQADHR